jgi:hypothetical protein
MYNSKTHLIGVEGMMNAAKSSQLQFDSGVIDFTESEDEFSRMMEPHLIEERRRKK